MSAMTIRLPNSLQKNLKALADQENISMNQLIVSAVTEKVSSLMTEDYLQERAARANEAAFMDVLGKIPTREPESTDRIS
jgi:predicted transcriptional regulator